MGAGDKFVGRDVAGRRFGLADVFNPMFDAGAAGGQFDQSADIVVECGDRADQDFFVDQIAEQEAGQRRRSADEFAAVDQHPISLFRSFSFASRSTSKIARPDMSSASAAVVSRALVRGVVVGVDVIGCTPQLIDMRSPACLHPRAPQPAIQIALYIL